MSSELFKSLPFPGLLADAILVVHALVVAFVVGGQAAVLLGWARGWDWVRRPGFRYGHLAVIAFVIAQTWLDRLCPLTIWEAELRRAAGQVVHDQSFVQYWVGNLLFFDLPWWVFQVAYTAFGLLVLISWIGCPPRWPRRSR